MKKRFIVTVAMVTAAFQFQLVVIHRQVKATQLSIIQEVTK